MRGPLRAFLNGLAGVPLRQLRLDGGNGRLWCLGLLNTGGKIFLGDVAALNFVLSQEDDKRNLELAGIGDLGFELLFFAV